MGWMWKSLIGIFLLSLGIFLYPYIFESLSQFIEKQSLKPPPPFKKLDSSVAGISTDSSGLVKYPHDYTLVLVGDSMTDRLGNSTELKGFLNEYFPDRTFEVLNYGFGSTNILSLPPRLEEPTIKDREYRAILNIDFDFILIESFGYNPLSELPFEEGLKKQNETLDYIVNKIIQTHPNSKIIFIATIAPNRKHYAKNTVSLNQETREKWVNERNSYIENHINYAKSHNLPIIDIYSKSKDRRGDGKLIFISQEDFIHPSPTGVLFISKQIANFLFQNKLISN